MEANPYNLYYNKYPESQIWEKGRLAGIKEVWEQVICPMCYRLNPQHATMDNGKGCHWCQDKEDWCGKTN